MSERRRITMERTFRAPIEAVWELWTSPEGIEAWLGPDGFTVKVHEMDVRPGGLLRYAMTAASPPQVDFMKRSGMALTTEARITYVEVVPHVRLAYTQLADFVPGVAPYDVAVRVDLWQTVDGVRQALTIDAMHDDAWTLMAERGWDNCLEKMGRLLATRQRVVPFLWFDDQAEEAANYYVSMFPGARLGKTTRFPAGGRGPEGSVMLVSFDLGGQEIVALNGNRRHGFTPSLSLLFKCRTAEEAALLTERLSEGGERQPGGWLKDRYGVSWQVVVAG